MKNIENISQDLFDKIRSRFQPVTMRGEDDKPTSDQSQGRFFEFIYQTTDGVKHGKISASIADKTSLKLSFYKGLPDKFNEIQQVDWKNFIINMRKFARRNGLKFDIRDITKSNLTKRDTEQAIINQQSMEQMVESVVWRGTTKTSIQEFGPVRLIVRHSEAVDTERPGARSRKIESMFVETDQGERFRMPYNRLSLGRAMAQHVAHGGKIYDDAGTHIQNVAEEMNSLAFFVRNTKNRTFEDSETVGMVESAVARYQQLRGQLNSISGTRGYQRFAENFAPETDNYDDYDIDSLKERFVKKMFDDRLTDALPYVYRAYQQSTANESNPFVKEFKGWAEEITNEEQFDEMDLDRLKELMSKPLTAGDQGINGISALADIIDNEMLNKEIKNQVAQAGPDIDIRPIIDQWFKENITDYVSQMPMPSDTNNLPVGQVDEPLPSKNESFDIIKKLAGLR